MKLFIRTIAITTIGMCVCFILMHLLDLTIRKDEIDKISRIAMNNTQIIMQENIEDKYYGTSNARKVISSNKEYENLYMENLKILQTTNGKYDVKFVSDYSKGMLSVDINYIYTNFLKEEKIINKKLTNIIDVVITQ